MKSRLKKFWKDHIIDTFPGPVGCFDCHAGSCQGCQTEAPMSALKEFIWSAMTVVMFLIIITLLFGAISGGY